MITNVGDLRHVDLLLREREGPTENSTLRQARVLGKEPACKSLPDS